MEAVRLTNLGNLTLNNLLRLEHRYEENAGLKRKKLSRLWPSEKEMNLFYLLFSAYRHQPVDYVLLREGDSYFIRDMQEGESIPLGPSGSLLIERFTQMGLTRLSQEIRPLEELATDIKKDNDENPIDYLRHVTIELTGLCNLRCRHCYRGGSREGEYGISANMIKDALEPLFRAGISGITFTGGEPLLRKNDLIDIIDYASQFMELQGVSLEERMQHYFGTPNPTIEDVLNTERYIKLAKQLMEQLSWEKEQLVGGDWNICNENTPEDVEQMLRSQAGFTLNFRRKPCRFDLDSICVLSNGFFSDQRGLIRKLMSYGNVSMQTSLDSYSEDATDLNRGRNGVFARVKSLVQISKEEGFDLSIMAHNIGGKKTEEASKNEIYFDRTVPLLEFDGMLQLGNAVRGDFKTVNPLRSGNYIGALSPANEDGWCDGFTEPEHLHIRPTGNVGNCLYAYAIPEEFGSLHKMPMADIVNGVQNTRVYRMFKDGSIERYQHELDKSLFAKRFLRSCEVVVLTLAYGIVKERLIEQGVENPVQIANEEVARMYKFNE